MAKNLDPTGRRTIRAFSSLLVAARLTNRTAVLTKPDRIATREHEAWVRLLENQTERFRHGWHCVKQSNQQQLDEGVSWAEARHNEISFFDQTPPWSTLEESIKSRLGTKFLTQHLGSILFELICQR